MKTYLATVWGFYFQIAYLVKADTKREAKEILCRHYQSRYPRIELEDIAIYDVTKLKFDKNGLHEILRAD